MKTSILLGAAITAFTYSTFASDALLTPRMKDNQAKIATSSISTQGGTVTYITSDSPVLLSPRAQDNQIKHVKGVESTAVKCPVIGSPKQVALAGGAGRTACCGLTVAQCATMDKMPK